jgi:RNA polymerase sigma factor (sigma-70 family)
MMNGTPSALVSAGDAAPLIGPRAAATATRGLPDCAPGDHLLVRACLDGDQRAWGVLLGRYRNLICSFARRYGASPADAADVFQLVSAELFLALPRMRSHQCVRSWIMTVSAHQAYQWKRRHLQRLRREGEDPEAVSASLQVSPSSMLEDQERERAVRHAVAQLAPRCRQIVRMLFFQDPPVPYQDVAGQLGLATGSVGFIRARCLRRLERLLAESGIRQRLTPCQREAVVADCLRCPHRATGLGTNRPHLEAEDDAVS